MVNRRRKSGYSGYGRSGNRRGIAFVAIVMLTVVLYFAAAGAAGTWMAEKVIQPVFSMLGIWTSPVPADGQDAQPSAPLDVNTAITNEEGIVITPSAAQTALSTPVSTAADGITVRINGLEVWYLQAGAFSTEQNAQAEAKRLQETGGAGYVYMREGRYRVMLAIYATEADARAVKDRLMIESNMETRVFALQGSDAQVTVSDPQQAGMLTRAMEDYDAIVDKLFAACRMPDNSSEAKILAQEARAEIAALSEMLRASFPSGTHAFANGLADLCGKTDTSLSQTLASDSALQNGIQLATAAFCGGYIQLLDDGSQ